jgi:dipeptidyl aminopeptidase/acylaminoacyl peptidase
MAPRWFALILLASTLHAQITERKQINPSTFAFDKQVAKYADEPEFASAKSDLTFRLERLLYRSDGLQVSAYLYSPAKAPSKPLPVIVFIRGGYVVQDQPPMLLAMFNRLAKQGFIVLAPMLRGSDGTEGHDEMGGADLKDLQAATALVKDLPGADANNVFLYGESRGAMMTYFALRDQWPVRAAAVYGGITEIGEYMKKIDPDEKFATTVWPGYAENKQQIFFSRSAINWPEKINAPILIMHGGADSGASPLHSLRMAEALTKLEKEYALHIFAGDNHTIRNHRVERDAMAVNWFKEQAAK